MESLPDLGELSPKEAQLVVLTQERARQIISTHAPRLDDPTPLHSPMARIRIEALAHVTALIKCHERGVTYHLDHNNPRQAALWERDRLRLESLWRQLASIPIT